MGLFSPKQCCGCGKDVTFKNAKKCRGGIVCDECRNKIWQRVPYVEQATPFDVQSGLWEYEELTRLSAEIPGDCDSFQISLAWMDASKENQVAMALGKYGFSVKVCETPFCRFVKDAYLCLRNGKAVYRHG